jgi:hypothetical protein
MEVRPMDRPSCPICGGAGEVREIYDDVEVYSPCECRGGRPAALHSLPVDATSAGPAPRREIFEALVAEPSDVRLYRIREQIALALATAAELRHLRGCARLADSGMILDNCHRTELLSNFRDLPAHVTFGSGQVSDLALVNLYEIVRHAPVRVRLSNA